ncbi:MAG TPA: serine/threonine-protein kinase, partial [Tepidisphaeraceae bacterium]|nr:serine/threonine-protein kinase [Tepidisphaeraceae bacterium]
MSSLPASSLTVDAMDGTARASKNVPSRLFGYEVLGFIGEGAGSTIYAVSDPANGQIYALKHVVRKNEKDIRFVEQLEAEFEVGQRVVHTNLRRVIAVKFNRTLLRKVNEAALVMELFDGVSLENEQPRSMAALIDIFRQTAGALHAVHSHGFVHCDLKPNNILFNSRNEVKVIDLGQACPVNTAKARIQGTPDFISPEQVKCKPVTPQTDVFNFGATLYYCLAMEKMPTLFTAGRKENSILSGDLIRTPAQCNPAVPESLSSFVMECVRLNPAKRPADMAEVGQRLDVFHHI